MIRTLAALLAFALLLSNGAVAEPSAERLAMLRRGLNITNWFRFPPNRDPAALRAYLDDAAMRDLRRAGFTFVRLPVQPEVLAAQGVAAVLADAVSRLERQGLAVVVVLHPTDWHLETEPADRASLAATWRTLAPLLVRFNPGVTYPEVLNEPVFADAPDAWARLQHQILADIRSTLPTNTVVLTGANWGSVAGLLALSPEADPNVVYSFHLYDPAELTALGGYRSGLDSVAMARLPFPVENLAACEAMTTGTADSPTAELMRFYCAQRRGVAKVNARITEAGEWGRRNRAAVVAGEFGATQKLNALARLAWLTAVREACEQQTIGWALWGYDDSMGFALRPPGRQHQLDPALLRALGLVDK
jgi:aryl-phospho-beta-D-glucosidase BglC (GH1 family)